MTLSLKLPESTVLKPQITVFGVGGAGCNATNNMILANLEGANFVVANTDAQSLENAVAEKRIQLGRETTKGLGAGSATEVGKKAAEEALDEINDHLRDSNMVFITAGMGGGTGTGAASVVAKAARDMGILTVGVVTKPFHFEGPRRMRLAEEGIEELQRHVDTLIIIPNQNLFRVANEKTTFADAFSMADAVLHAGVRGITDLMVMPGLINLDFADVRAVMSEMGKAMMGTGEASGEKRAQEAAEAAISNPLLDNVSMKGARGVLINITGGSDMTLFEVDEAANRIREEVDPSANIIFGSTFNDNMEGKMRVSVVATGIDAHMLTNSDDSQSSNQEAVAEEPKGEPLVKETISTVQIQENSQAIEEQKQSQQSVESDAVSLHPTEDQVGDKEEVKEAQNAIENATQAAYQQLKQEVEKTFAPSELDTQYFEAIKNLNDEYNVSKTEKPNADNNVVKGHDSIEKHKPFMAAAPVEPQSYVQTSHNAPSEELIHSESVAGGNVDEDKGGIFSRMAKVARSLKNDQSEGANDDWNSDGSYRYSEENSSQSGPSASGSDQRKEELLDVPAFLRREM